MLAGPLGIAARATLGWLVAAVLVVPVVAALLVAWDMIRELYLAPATLDPQVALGRIVVTLAFAALWVAVTLMAGIASAIRGALWSGASVH